MTSTPMEGVNAELLEALMRLVQCCEQHPAFRKQSNTITAGRMALARAAIAKATAGQVLCAFEPNTGDQS